MKKYMEIIIVGIFIIVILLLLAFTNSNPSDQKNIKIKKFSDKELFVYNKQDGVKKDSLLQHYEILPPLSPERFRRRVKMLWGIDINDYPESCMLSLGGLANIYYYFNLDRETQIIQHGGAPEEDFLVIPEHPGNIYSKLRRHLFINDMSMNSEMLAYKNKCLEEIKWDHPNMENIDITEICCDLIYMGYTSALFNGNKTLYHYAKEENYSLLSADPANLETQIRYTDIRLNTIFLYLKESVREGNTVFLGFDNRERNLNQVSIKSPKTFLMAITQEVTHSPWHSYTKEKGITAFLSFLLSLNDPVYEKFVIQVISGQADSYLGGKFGEWDTIRITIRENNYYGYTLLREFCENPMREMPTFEKVGESFQAKVKEPNTLLYLEPFADSYDIDTVQPDETLTAYEMGYDDYYFIEIQKPVESPVAGPDGYAMIIDRSETVYGYLPKLHVTEYTVPEISIEMQNIEIPTSKKRNTTNWILDE